MKKYMFWLVCLLIFVVATDVLAETTGTDPFGIAMKKAVEAFRGTRALVFTVGGFALVGFAGAAIFGKIKWQWVSALAVGLGVLAVAGYIIDYAATSDDRNISTQPAYDASDNYWK